MVNPVFNTANIIVQDLASYDRLGFVVRDIGLLQETHLGGFGPQTVASASMPVEDFSGWLELSPAVDVPGNGGPVMLLEVKVREATTWPSEGSVADRVGVFESAGVGDGVGVSQLRCSSSSESGQALQGVQLTVPSAPAAHMAPAADMVPEPEVMPEPEMASAEVAEVASASAEVASASRSGGVPRSADDAGIPAFWGDLRWQIFHIPEETWSFYKTGQLADMLIRMSDLCAMF